jgi:hypothetical protein
MLRLDGATVLICKLEFWIFQEAVHQDDEFAHGRRQGQLGFFPSRPKAKIKGF